MEQDEIEFSYIVEQDDYINFNIHTQMINRNIRNKKKSRFIQKVKSLGINLLIIAIICYLLREANIIEGILVMVITGIFFITIKHKHNENEIERLNSIYESNKLMQQECKCRFNTRGFVSKQKNATYLMEWDMIYEVVTAKDYCYIYYGKNAAFIIPLKNLKNDNQINCFFSIIKNNISDDKFIIVDY